MHMSAWCGAGFNYLEMKMNSREIRKATQRMEFASDAFISGMRRMASNANEAAQALGQFGSAMKAVKWPVPNAGVERSGAGGQFRTSDGLCVADLEK